MTNIGRVAVSALSAVAESTQALVNINFDFAAVKISPPEEFRELGQALTPTRRQMAEEGPLHVTARQLGAIFKSLLPETPNLIKCYGSRVSEVAKSETASGPPSSCGTRGGEAFLSGLLSGHVGVDGTSIWAGATSGSGAIQVHLLACMLARMWDGPEAVSIWVELLKRRKTEIQERLADSRQVDVGTVVAIHKEVSRSQLAEWDASARAWLRIADSAKTLQQKQLLLIIGDTNKYVNSKRALYDSVIQMWTAGLDGMESLLSGCPLQMKSGEILLALASWHLYPDLNVLDVTTKLVRQHDPLVPMSGILTLGLKNSGQEEEPGLKWSLPLAHLRYYGDPVQRTSSIRAEGSRLSLSEFNMAFLGCLLGSWRTSDADVEAVLKWLVKLAENITSLYRQKGVGETWLEILADTSQNYLRSKGLDRQVYTQLLRLGKHHSDFIGDPSEPFFGLTDALRAMALAKTMEHKIHLLRCQATRAGIHWDHAIIRYLSEETGREEYASAAPFERPAMKRSKSGERKATVGHRRWVSKKAPRFVPEHSDADDSEGVKRDMFLGADSLQDTLDPFEFSPPACHDYPLEPRPPVDYEAQFQRQTQKYEALGEDVLEVEVEPIVTVHMTSKPVRVIWGHVSLTPTELLEPYHYWDGPVKHYEQWLGDIRSASLLIRLDVSAPRSSFPLQLADMQLLFEGDNLNRDTLAQTMVSAVNSLGEDFAVSMRALSTFNQLYRRLKQSTIDVRVFGRSLPRANSIQFLVAHTSGTKLREDVDVKSDFGMSSPSSRDDEFLEAAALVSSPPRAAPAPIPPTTDEAQVAISTIATSSKWQAKYLTTQESFSAILYLENSFDIHPSQLQSVMAISSGNSIFIANALLSDPSERPSRVKIRHVMGNVGRPGTALLVPPLEPRIMKPGLNHWHLVNHTEWNGEVRDCFPDTTLHLWFTEKEQEVDIGYSGAQDTELYMLESVVSVHGGGQWVADLDILQALTDRSHLYRWRGGASHATPSATQIPNAVQPVFQCVEGHDLRHGQHQLPLISVENWMELLNLPSKSSIFLASGNWQARLAATVIAVAMRKTVCVLGDTVCWGCIQRLRDSKTLEDPAIYVF